MGWYTEESWFDFRQGQEISRQFLGSFIHLMNGYRCPFPQGYTAKPRIYSSTRLEVVSVDFTSSNEEIIIRILHNGAARCIPGVHMQFLSEPSNPRKRNLLDEKTDHKTTHLAARSMRG